jgi:hypothetical protein
VFFLIKETTGVGDFVGTAGRPTPMAEHEIEKMLRDSKKPEDEPIVKLSFEKGEHVIIKEGPFENYEGTVDELLPEKGLVRVLVTIFGRQAPIELEEWQIAKADEGTCSSTALRVPFRFWRVRLLVCPRVPLFRRPTGRPCRASRSTTGSAADGQRRAAADRAADG